VTAPHTGLNVAPCAGGCGTTTLSAFCRACWKCLPHDLADAISNAPTVERYREAIASAAVHLLVGSAAHVVLPRTPRPDPVSGTVTWKGGVQVLGPLLKIPGRTLDVDNLDEAEQHATAVLSAIAYMRRLHQGETR